MTRNLIILFAIVIGFASCQSKSNKEAVEQRKQEAEFDETSKALNEKFGEMLGTMSNTEISGWLQSVGANFDPSFLNDPQNAEYYLPGDGKAAANLGIYYIDLRYAAAYEKRDLTVSLFGAAQSIASKLGIERSLDQALLDRLGDEMNDDTKQALEEALKDASTNLNNDNRPRLAGAVMLGIIIERLHIFSLIIDQALDKKGLSPEDIALLTTPVMKATFDQGAAIDMLDQYLKMVRNPDDPIRLFSYMGELQGEFQALRDMKDEFDRTQSVDPRTLDRLFEVSNEMRTVLVTPAE